LAPATSYTALQSDPSERTHHELFERQEKEQAQARAIQMQKVQRGQQEKERPLQTQEDYILTPPGDI
jgi:hypothetical protein